MLYESGVEHVRLQGTSLHVRIAHSIFISVVFCLILVGVASCFSFISLVDVNAQTTDAPAPPAALAPSASIGITPGSVAISGFSGNTLSAESLAPGVDPIDKTVIDLNGPSVRVFDLTSLGQRPAGQLLNPPVKFEVKAKDIGQVFPLALDDGSASRGTPNLYAGATAAFGIQIVAAQPDSEGKPVRLKAGAPGARFMDGQFGGLPGIDPDDLENRRDFGRFFPLWFRHGQRNSE